MRALEWWTEQQVILARQIIRRGGTVEEVKAAINSDMTLSAIRAKLRKKYGIKIDNPYQVRMHLKQDAVR